MLRPHHYTRTRMQRSSGAKLRQNSNLYLCLLLVTLTIGTSVSAEPLKALADGKQPDDRRLQPLLDLNGYFPFEPATTPQDWNHRAKQIRRRILVSQGLWPMPLKTPLQAVIHGKLERETYTVEKVYFESFPGFYVTGNLYRPRSVSGKAPAALTVTGPTVAFTTRGQHRPVRKSHEEKSSSPIADAVTCRHVASPWRDWAASCFTTT